MVASYANPQALNRYSYVLNNPVKLIDPTGHKCVDQGANGNTMNVDCDTGSTTGLSTPSSDGKIIHHHNNSGKDDHKFVKIIQDYVNRCINNSNGQGCTPGKPDGIFPVNKQFSWRALDGWDIAINVVGIVGDFALDATPAGNAPGPAEWLLTEGVELTGIVRDAYKTDYSALSKDGVSKVINVVLEQKNSRDLIPVVGFIFNAFNIIGDVRNAYVDRPDTTPYSPPTIGPAP